MWSKVTFYYKHQLSGLVATTEDANYPVSNILDRLNGTLYKGLTTVTHYITYDAGVGNSITCDYFALGGDNLAGATVALEFSDDNFASDIRQAFAAFARSAAEPVVKEFASISGRYSRMKMTGLSVAPQISLAHWGQLTELNYASGDFDPDAVEFKGNINVTPTGYLTGVHKKCFERQIQFKLQKMDDALWQKLYAWWYDVEMRCFFMAWEKTNHPADVWIVRPTPGKFNNPLTSKGLYRTGTISLLGRK